MTKAEAEKKWCPFVRYAVAEKGGSHGAAFTNRVDSGKEFDNPSHTNGGASRCITSDCMAWRGQRGGGYCGLVGR